MPVIEHHRHAMRQTPHGVHLIQAGVDLARKVGAGLGPFHRVITSEIPRAFETAIAMGFAVDDQEPILGSVLTAPERIDWSLGCVAFAEAYRAQRSVFLAAEVHAELMRRIAASLPADGRALVVSHGGIIELGVVGLLPHYDYAGWGESCGYCEGVRLHFEGATCTRAELLRIDDLVRA